ncbi:hypothetical protein ACVWY4_005367 [Bacillus mycoides]
MENRPKAKLELTKEQSQRFLNPIIKFIKKNPHLFKNTKNNDSEK